jgi:hypothetical protein
MRVKDQHQWDLWLADSVADQHPLTSTFRQFVQAWAEHAEHLHDQKMQASEVIAGNPPDPMTPMDSLRNTLVAAELTLPAEHISIGLIGGALAVLIMHWEYGTELYEQMTPIEKHLVDDAIRVKQLNMAIKEKEEAVQ